MGRQRGYLTGTSGPGCLYRTTTRCLPRMLFGSLAKKYHEQFYQLWFCENLLWCEEVHWGICHTVHIGNDQKRVGQHNLVLPTDFCVQLDKPIHSIFRKNHFPQNSWCPTNNKNRNNNRQHFHDLKRKQEHCEIWPATQLHHLNGVSSAQLYTRKIPRTRLPCDAQKLMPKRGVVVLYMRIWFSIS